SGVIHSILVSWMEARRRLYQAVCSHLLSETMTVYCPEDLPWHLRPWKTAEAEVCLSSFIQSHPDTDPAEARLMLCCATGRFVMDDDVTPVEDEEDALEGEVEELLEIVRRDDGTAVDLELWLERLAALPNDASEWEHLPDFLSEASRLLERKAAQRK